MSNYDFGKEVLEQYKKLTTELIKKNITITTMESCTSGQIASLITDTEGASGIFKGSFVTYSNEAKIMSGVPSEIIDKFGVYSKETAISMANACKNTFNTNVGIGVTGTLGNIDPNNADSVAGKVFFAIIYNNETYDFQINLNEHYTKHEYKLIIAKEVAKEILKLI